MKKLDPKTMVDWQRAAHIARWIILINLIAFCAVMGFIDLALYTQPTAATPPPTTEAPTFLDKHDAAQR